MLALRVLRGSTLESRSFARRPKCEELPGRVGKLKGSKWPRNETQFHCICEKSEKKRTTTLSCQAVRRVLLKKRPLQVGSQRNAEERHNSWVRVHVFSADNSTGFRACRKKEFCLAGSTSQLDREQLMGSSLRLLSLRYLPLETCPTAVKDHKRPNWARPERLLTRIEAKH